MTSPFIQLNAVELASALGAVAAVDLLAAELGGRNPPAVGARLLPWHEDPGLVVLEDDGGHARCVLPAAGLRDCRMAALTGLAARELAVRGPMTAVVIGPGTGSGPLLAVLVHQFPEVGRIAFCPARGGRGAVIEQRLVDEIDLAGVTLTVVDDARRAVRGAALVVIRGPAGHPLAADAFSAGALVVDASEDAVACALAADQVYVDDARLAGGRTVEADLGQVLTGAHPGRTRPDHVILVELLSANAPAASLACLLHRAAVERGFGIRLIG